MVTIPNLTEVTAPGDNDDVVIEIGAGTRRVTRRNLMLRRAELTILEPGNVNLANDLVWVGDATDGFVKGVSAFDIVFGNYTNFVFSDDFTLDPATMNARTLECVGTFTTGNITLDGTTTNIGGASFHIINFTGEELTILPANITLFNDGASVASHPFRDNTALSISVRDNASEAVVTGG